jgi:hypothetical protein
MGYGFEGLISYANKKAALPPVTFTLVTVGSPAVLGSLRIRDFLSLPYGRFGFDCCDAG